MPPRSRGLSLRYLKGLVTSENGPLFRCRMSSCSQRRPDTFTLPASPFHTDILSRSAFSTTVTNAKKSSSSSRSPHIPASKATANRDREVDPYDFTELEVGIASAISRLRDALTKTRGAGRVTVDMVENLPVELNVRSSTTSAHKERTKLGDVASVVPKGGRTLHIFCGEEAHMKPISSAVQSSPYSLVPQLDSTNPLLLVVPVPPATAETRGQAAAEAKKVMDRAALEVRNARGDAQKRFRKMELGKMVVQDEIRKAHKAMEEVVRKGHDEVKRIYDGALRALEQ